VARGDILVVLEQDEEQAALKAAKAQLDERKAAYQRAQELVTQQALSTATLEEREAMLSQAEGTIERLEALIRDRVIRAPFDGVLGLREISVGALLRPGDVITTLDDIRRIKVDFDAPSLFLSDLRSGLEVQGQVDAFENRVFTGIVSSVSTRVDPVTRTVSARAELPNDDQSLRPGLLMAIHLIKNPRESLVIPESALIQRGEESFVFVIEEEEKEEEENKIAVETAVRTGARVAGRIEILSGLEESDLVIIHGLMQVRNRQPVEVSIDETGGEPLASFTGDKLRSNGER
jgi:membrane fusion protein, multidrug efflux system